MVNASLIHSYQVKTTADEEPKRTSPLPGLALGCEPAEVKFQQWERRKKQGVLKSMFKWKVNSKQPYVEPNPENKNKEESPDNTLAKKQEKVDRTCQENIDRTIIKILSRRSRRSGLKKKQGEIC